MGGMSRIRVRRIYEDPEPSDGARVLVDRLWPRGISKERAQLDLWLREVAPSTALRKWYAHDPERYAEFAKRYRGELTDADHAEALAVLREFAERGVLTLLTASKAVDISEAVVLKGLLDGD